MFGIQRMEFLDDVHARVRAAHRGDADGLAAHEGRGVAAADVTRVGRPGGSGEHLEELTRNLELVGRHNGEMLPRLRRCLGRFT